LETEGVPDAPSDSGPVKLSPDEVAALKKPVP
jgi:hypothetical protein